MKSHDLILTFTAPYAYTPPASDNGSGGGGGGGGSGGGSSVPHPGFDKVMEGRRRRRRKGGKGKVSIQ